MVKLITQAYQKKLVVMLGIILLTPKEKIKISDYACCGIYGYESTKIFKENYNDLESMRYAMSVTFCIFIPSVISFLIVARVLPKDWDAADKRNLESTKS